MPCFQGLPALDYEGGIRLHTLYSFIKYCQHSRVQVLSGEPSKTAPRLFLFSLKIRLGAIATSRRQKAQRTSTSEEGAPAKSHDFVGRGGITEQASFGTLCPEVSKRSLCRRVPKSAGFGEAPQQAFLRPLGAQNGKCGYTCPACQTMRASSLLFRPSTRINP